MKSTDKSDRILAMIRYITASIYRDNNGYQCMSKDDDNHVKSMIQEYYNNVDNPGWYHIYAGSFADRHADAFKLFGIESHGIQIKYCGEVVQIV